MYLCNETSKLLVKYSTKTSYHFDVSLNAKYSFFLTSAILPFIVKKALTLLSLELEFQFKQMVSHGWRSLRQISQIMNEF